MKLGYSGIEGSFSEEAALFYASQMRDVSEKGAAKEIETVPLLDMDGVLEAIKNGEIDQGIFPVVNSTGGLVQTAFEAMGRYNFVMKEKLPFEVHQCLMAKPGTGVMEIKKVASHPQALSQCENYLKTKFPNAELIEWSDTASAARDLQKGELSEDTAVLAPAQSAKQYSLQLLEERVQDNHPNITTFIIVKPPRHD